MMRSCHAGDTNHDAPVKKRIDIDVDRKPEGGRCRVVIAT